MFPNMNLNIEGIERLGPNHKNPIVVLAWLLKNNDNVADKLKALKWDGQIFNGVEAVLNSLNFDPEHVKTHDSKVKNYRKELGDMSGLVDDPEQADRLAHLSGYQAQYPGGDELMGAPYNIPRGPELGQKQKELATQHYQQSWADYIRRKKNNSNYLLNLRRTASLLSFSILRR